MDSVNAVLDTLNETIGVAAVPALYATAFSFIAQAILIPFVEWLRGTYSFFQLKFMPPTVTLGSFMLVALGLKFWLAPEMTGETLALFVFGNQTLAQFLAAGKQHYAPTKYKPGTAKGSAANDHSKPS